MKRPLAIAGAAAFAALFFLSCYPVLVLPVLAAGVIGGLLSFLLRRKINWKPLACVGAIISVSSILFLIHYEVQCIPALELMGSTAEIEAHLESEPELENGRYTYLFVTDQINGERFQTGMRLYSYDEIPAAPYDTVRMRAALAPSWKTESMRQYALSNRQLFTASEVELHEIVLFEGNLPLSARLSRFREALSEEISANLGRENAGLLCGILFGDKSGLPDSVSQDFQQLGISHLLAVSGLHMSVWAMTLFSLLNRARLGRRAASAISAGFVLFFMALTGFTPSVQRSGIMLLLYLASFWFKRKPDSLNSLGGSLLLILLVNPFDAGNVGLILSALATFGILTLHARFSRWYAVRTARISPAPVRRIGTAIAEVVSISVCATLFTLPVTLWYFGQIPLLSPLSNLLIANFAAPAMISGGIAALSSLAGMAVAAQPLFVFSGILLRGMARLSAAFADIPFVSVHLNAEWVGQWVIALIVIGLVFPILLTRKWRVTVLAYLAALAILTGCAAGYAALRFRDQAVLQIVSGSNPCVLIRSAGQSVLIGSGRNGTGLRLLADNNLYRPELVFFWADDPAVDQVEISRRCRSSETVRQGELFRAELEGEMAVSSDGEEVMVSVNGKTVRIAENLVWESDDILIAGGLSGQADYAGRIAVETNTRYAKGTNALTVPSDGVIIVQINSDSQVTVNGGT